MHFVVTTAVLVLLGGCIHLPPPIPPPATTEGEVRAMAAMVNDHRAAIGCRPLSWDGRLADLAESHSADMAARGFYGHTTPDGVTLTDRLRTTDIVWRGAGENIARTQFGAEQVFYLWMQSDRHRANIEACRFNLHGIGLVEDLWTHVFVDAPGSGAPPN